MDYKAILMFFIGERCHAMTGIMPDSAMPMGDAPNSSAA
jgi:hypothetical protein